MVAHFYFNLFSKVCDDRAVKCTRLRPYSAVKTNDLGRSSQGITTPFCSALLRNSLVLLEVEVLSISKIPIIELSRTAMSFPIDKYIGHILVGEGQCPSLICYFLKFCVKTILIPFYRIIFYIFPNFLVTMLIPNNMIVK